MDTDHFGQTLRDARLKAGRSLDDISRRTKIPAPTLERLERGDTDALPADVFVCGFLRAFAREVGIDAEATVARYRRDTRSTVPAYADLAAEEGSEPADAERDAVALRDALARPAGEAAGSVDALIGKLTARVPVLEGALGRGPAFALVVLLVVLVATITLSILLGGDPRPGQGLS